MVSCNSRYVQCSLVKDLLDGLLVAALVDVPGDDDGAKFGEFLRKKSADTRTASGDLETSQKCHTKNNKQNSWSVQNSW